MHTPVLRCGRCGCLYNLRGEFYAKGPTCSRVGRALHTKARLQLPPRLDRVAEVAAVWDPEPATANVGDIVYDSGVLATPADNPHAV